MLANGAGREALFDRLVWPEICYVHKYFPPQLSKPISHLIFFLSGRTSNAEDEWRSPKWVVGFEVLSEWGHFECLKLFHLFRVLVLIIFHSSYSIASCGIWKREKENAGRSILRCDWPRLLLTPSSSSSSSFHAIICKRQKNNLCFSTWFIPFFYFHFFRRSA